jgi:hypothetical protein
MKREVLMLIFLFTVGKLVASDIQWSEGSLVLNNKEVLCGKISVEEKYDMVLFKAGDRVDVYPAHSIQAVFYYDENAHINRKYIVLEDTKRPMRRVSLYEIVLSGPVVIVRHVKNVSFKPYSDAKDFQYYVRYEKELVSLEKFRSRVYDKLVNDAGLSLSVFVTENKLDPNVSAHAIQIVEAYNDLVRSAQTMARQ